MNSIAMCTYNGEKYIQEQLQSILHQTMQPDEIIICDDCSQDRTVDRIQCMLKDWQGHWKLVVNETNLGYKKNFQRAISLCNGDIIYLSDQDDTWESTKIEIMHQAFAEHPNAVIVFHDAVLVNEKMQLLYPSFWNILEFHPEEFLSKNYHVLFKRNVLQGSACAFKKSVFTRAVPFPEEAVHDEWLLLTGITMGSVIPIKRTLMKYRQGHNVLGGTPEKIIHKLKKWTVKCQSTIMRHYDELLRRAAIFKEYEKRCRINKNMPTALDCHEFNQFLQYRQHCIITRNVSILQAFFQYKHFFNQWSFSMKEIIKDYMSMWIKNK
jgi:glycosyltransferase involved in cell wall biosynthesis